VTNGILLVIVLVIVFSKVEGARRYDGSYNRAVVEVQVRRFLFGFLGQFLLLFVLIVDGRRIGVTPIDELAGWVNSRGWSAPGADAWFLLTWPRSSYNIFRSCVSGRFTGRPTSFGMAEISVSSKLVTLIGLVAAFCTTVALVPQVLHTYRSRRTKDISLGMYLILTLGLLLWLVYGLIRKDLPLILANSVSLSLTACVLFLKIKHG